MKKAFFRIVMLVCVMMFTISAAALSPGERMGWVLHTDIIAYINDTPIRSYNIGGNTYVVAEELADYGFNVNWDATDADGVLRISEGTGIVRSTYTVKPNSHRPGDTAMPYVFTDILTYMAGQPVWGANIDGKTCVSVDDLAYFFADRYAWDPAARELRMTLRENGAAVVPDRWSFSYQTPEYDKDVAVSGEGAMWEFAKNDDGLFELTDSAGETLFTPQIDFGDDRMSYQVHFGSRQLGLAGSTFFTSAPHAIKPHSTIERTLNEQNLFLGSLYGLSPAPGYFRGYVLQNKAKADELLSKAAEATARWRVYINGEWIRGLPVTMPSGYYNALDGRMKTSREFVYLYERRVPLSEVKTVRIEIGD